MAGKRLPSQKRRKIDDYRFWKPVSYKCEVENSETGELEIIENQACVARSYPVFNGSQVEGFGEDVEKAEFTVKENVMAFFENTDIYYSYGENVAAYDSKNDIVLLPNKDKFKQRADLFPQWRMKQYTPRDTKVV